MGALAFARIAGAAAFALALVGCAQAPRPLYHWGSYQTQLYEHFKSDSSGPAEQLRLLEAEALRAQGAGLPLPPGFRGHLAMLYLRLGRDTEARLQLEAEKAHFPESAPFMDFLLKRAETKKDERKPDRQDGQKKGAAS